MDRSSFEESQRARAEQREADGHPAPGDLAAYHAGRLTDQRAAQIKDHLAVCAECSRLLESLVEFEHYRPEPNPSGEDPSAAAWLRLRDRIREEEASEAAAQEEPRTAVQPLQRRKVPVWEKPGVAWAVAAVFALCAVGLGIRGMTPPEPPAERSEIGFRAYTSLERNGTMRGGKEEEGVVTIDPLVEAVDFELPIEIPAPEATYEVALFTAEQNKLLWNGTKPESGEYLVVGVPRIILAPGSYRFEVSKVEANGSKTQTGTYRFLVR